MWREMALERLRAWGFNTIGNWSEPGLLARRELAYVVPIHTYGNYARVSGGWDKVPDPFDPAFAEAVDGIVSNAASTHRGDPWLIGYFVDNELAWGVGNAPDPRLRYVLAVETLRLDMASPAKRAFIAQLSEKYREVENLAAMWGILDWAGRDEPDPTRGEPGETSGHPGSAGVQQTFRRDLFSGCRRGHPAPRPASSLPGQPVPDAHAGSGGCVRKIL